MDPYEQFNKSVMNAAEEFKNVDKKEVIRLISHLDADGISSASIMIKLLNSDNRKYSVTIVPQLNRAVITQFASESYNCFIFTDLGSGMVSEIQELLKGRKIFILDHHAVEESAKYGDIVFVNPHLFGIDGGKEISGAGVVLKFACAVDKAMEDMEIGRA